MNITDLVARAQKDSPLPADWRDLPAVMQRDLQRRADEAGVEPAKIYASMKASTERDAADTATADEIVKAIRRR